MSITLQNEHLSAAISETGAELHSLKLLSTGTEYLWQGDPAWWPSRAPLLFPIVGGLPGGSYTHEGKSYKLGNHGFARKKIFTVVEAGDHRAALRLVDTEETRASYPFPFLLEVGFALNGASLAVTWTVTNPGSAVLPFAIGAHPGFNVPLSHDQALSDHVLRFEKKESLSRRFLNEENAAFAISKDERALSDADELALSASLFDRGALVFAGQKSTHVTLASRGGKRAVRVRFPGFTHLGIWAKAGGAPYVCIEPWFGVMGREDGPAELSRREGMLKLEPGKTWSAVHHIEPS
jgi:galactose mutarotase-like enzyme